MNGHRRVFAGDDAGLLSKLLVVQQALLDPTLTLDAMLVCALQQTQALVGADGAVLQVPDGDGLVFRAATGTAAGEQGFRLPEASLSGRCLASGETLWSDDAEQDGRVDPLARRRLGVRSLVVAPVTAHGATIGVLGALSSCVGAFGPRERDVLQLLAGVVGVAFQRSEAAA
ncbi:MAG: GAF domain-containing protein, partial [Myxococcales bacterium]